MILFLDNNADRAKFKTYCEHLLEKKAYVEVKEKKPQRSLSQNKYLHVCLAYFASEFGYDLETVKQDIFKKIVNEDIFKRERNNRHGTKVIYLRSTAELNTEELTTALERFRNYSATQAGLYIPEPNEQQAIMEAERQIAMFEQYL